MVWNIRVYIENIHMVFIFTWYEKLKYIKWKYLYGIFKCDKFRSVKLVGNGRLPSPQKVVGSIPASANSLIFLSGCLLCGSRLMVSKFNNCNTLGWNTVPSLSVKYINVETVLYYVDRIVTKQFVNQQCYYCRYSSYWRVTCMQDGRNNESRCKVVFVRRTWSSLGVSD